MEEASGPPVEIWPDNLTAVNLFIAVLTQWRVGIAGATGLDYNVVFHKMDRMKLSDDAYEQLESDIRTMEDAALAEIRKK